MAAPQGPIPAFSDLHMPIKHAAAASHLFPGAKFTFTKGLAETFQVQHNFEFSQGPPGSNNYLFNATYVDLEAGDEKPRSIVVSNLDTNGGLLARMTRQITNSLSTTLMFQNVTQEGKSQMYTQLEAEYAGSDFNASLKLAEPDIVNESGIVIASYLQSIRNFFVGGDLRYQYSDGIEQAIVSVGGAYKGDEWSFYSTLVPSMAAFNLSYMKKIHPTTNLFIDYEGSLFQETKLSAGYEANLQQASVRGQITSDGDVIGTLERKMGPGVSFKLCGSLNHKTEVPIFGFGFFIGGP